MKFSVLAPPRYTFISPQLLVYGDAFKQDIQEKYKDCKFTVYTKMNRLDLCEALVLFNKLCDGSDSGQTDEWTVEQVISLPDYILQDDSEKNTSEMPSFNGTITIRICLPREILL